MPSNGPLNKKFSSYLPFFRLLGWLGVLISILSRFYAHTTSNPYFLYVGLPLTCMGVIGMIICYLKK